ncbi:hypothetical protein NDU88_001759 [Pleurodeles waltl]|uniref:Uncharacterized protein n=1 Tax=Pleurodeles waltl TaxID=8319 RepID=A0AAV7P9P5_PLEWA|nr:hypothetical protein NDU88_001759 [Pleurodeles waltl]
MAEGDRMQTSLDQGSPTVKSSLRRHLLPYMGCVKILSISRSVKYRVYDGAVKEMWKDVLFSFLSYRLLFYSIWFQ